MFRNTKQTKEKPTPKKQQKPLFLVVLKYSIFQQWRYTIVTLTYTKLDRI